VCVGAEALAEDFNDFFHSIASKYGLDTPTPTSRPAAETPAAAASASAGFEFRTQPPPSATQPTATAAATSEESSEEREESVVVPESEAAESPGSDAASVERPLAAHAAADDTTDDGGEAVSTAMQPQHSLSPERPKTSRGRESMSPEVWAVQAETSSSSPESSTEPGEEEGAPQPQHQQRDAPQPTEEVGEVGLRPDGFPHGTGSWEEPEEPEEQEAAHMVAGVQAWLRSGADTEEPGAFQHEEEEDSPLYESHDDYPRTRYPAGDEEEVSGGRRDAFERLDAVLPFDGVRGGGTPTAHSDGDEPTTLPELNQMLRDNGFASVSAGVEAARPADLLQRLSEVLCQYERRSTMVQVRVELMYPRRPADLLQRLSEVLCP
jgi:hypothetical protein